jgi:mono/diheme cytochrome c family protein
LELTYLNGWHGSKGGNKLRGLVFLLSILLFSPTSLRAGQNNGPRLTESEELGKRLFFQRCSFCHLGMPTKYRTYGPVLDRDILEALGDETARQTILSGSARMPGFKYALNLSEINGIIAYLKTVKKEDVVQSSSAH